MNVDEFVEILESWYKAKYHETYTYDLWAWGNLDYFLGEIKEIHDLTFEIVDMKDKGTREDFTDPEPVYYVVRVTEVNNAVHYFRRNGVIQSFDGDELGEWYKVTPAQKIITVYE